MKRISVVASLALAALALQGACTPKETRSPSREPAAVTPEKTVRGTVIYGDDNRKDLYQEPSAALREAAESTVALIRKAALQPDGPGRQKVKSTLFKDSFRLCTGEPFADQGVAAFCSGFLVGPDLMATAGHCIKDDKDCAEISFVFGFAYTASGAAPTHVPDENVYQCAQVLHREAVDMGTDYALVRLDRAVRNHRPLKMRSQGAVSAGDPLVVIGHPSGLPTKIADGSHVRSTDPAKAFFVADLDTYGGNSGSAVFNRNTLEVEGILVRGESDFEWTQQGCAKSYVCAQNLCRGEDVTRIGEVVRKMPAR